MTTRDRGTGLWSLLFPLGVAAYGVYSFNWVKSNVIEIAVIAIPLVLATTVSLAWDVRDLLDPREQRAAN